MSKAFVTFGVGGHRQLLDVALPSFEAFCDRHGYDLVIPEPVDSPRPPSWWKVPMLLAALDEYDEAVFVGCDFVIIDPSEDFPAPPEAWQALVEHQTGDGLVPNADMWLVRQPMRPVLAEVWAKSEYTHHGWWEQAALIDLMGYKGRPSVHVESTPLYEHTHFLDAGWNVHMWDMREAHPRFLHATMYPDRESIMRQWAQAAALVAA